MRKLEFPRRGVSAAAWVSGPLAVLLGAGAHLLGGGALPGPWVLLALTALSSMLASILAGLKLPVWALLLLSGLVQQVLHLMFYGLSGYAGGSSSEHAHGRHIWSPPPLAQTSGGHAASELMLDAHVAAALLAVLVITQSGVLFSRFSRLRRVRARRQLSGP
ncbi:hypothetical protein [Pseudarthrobacter sulfonivorans]|uniref:hypothetical protein n=1 Tax=Pseudarthrobacter sulfonivorans TaxID=121292 RepID=UPI002789ED1C|nr:hypothetical protein [Pseudarthrobacter sulfonivorans]MDP9998379.1 hypothetical protein [Pseudarthrobacter sulfonivorans]